MNWFRLYDDLLDDPKVQQLPPALFKHWINVLCLASKASPRGVLPDITEVAFRLRLSSSKAQAVLDELAGLGLLEEGEGGGWHPHNWFGRQRQSDDVAARVRKHRTGDSGNESVTLLKRTVDRTDTERENNDPPNPPKANGVASPVATYFSVLNSGFPRISSDFHRLDPELTPAWLKNALRGAEARAGPLASEQIVGGLELAFLRIERAVSAPSKDHPIHNMRGFAADAVKKALEEQAHANNR